jgi:hypothetical protein
MTSPVASSQNTAETETSLGSNLTTYSLVLSSDFLIDTSVLITNLFLSVFDKEDR